MNQVGLEAFRKYYGMSDVYDEEGRIVYKGPDKERIDRHVCKGQACERVPGGYRTWGSAVLASTRKSFCCPRRMCVNCLNFTNSVPDTCDPCDECSAENRCVTCYEQIQSVLRNPITKKGIPKCERKPKTVPKSECFSQSHEMRATGY